MALLQQIFLVSYISSHFLFIFPLTWQISLRFVSLFFVFVRVCGFCYFWGFLFFAIFPNICRISGQETQYSWDLFMFPFPKNFRTILLLLHTGFLAATSSKSSVNTAPAPGLCRYYLFFFPLKYPYLNPLHVSFWVCVHVVLAQVMNLYFNENPRK